MEHRGRGVPGWVWVLVVLAAIILVFMVWFVVSASTRRPTVVVPPEQQPAVQPSQQQQPVIVKRERPVTIYVQRNQPQPKVYVIPEGKQPPEAKANVEPVNLPSQFRYQSTLWQPSGQAFTSDHVMLKDTGLNVGGNIVYARQDAQAPYNAFYLETQPGSGVFIEYTPTG